MDPSVSFKLSQVLPSDGQSAAIARFVILARQTRAIDRALVALYQASPETNLEPAVALLCYYIGSLKELADAFRDVDAQGLLG